MQDETQGIVQERIVPYLHDIRQLMLIERCGNYTDMKGLTEKQVQQMWQFIMNDTCALNIQKINIFSEQYILLKLQQKDKNFITMLYLYCNWRAWHTYKNKPELAREYQDICDFIDARIFDDWRNTEELQYFIRETD